MATGAGDYRDYLRPTNVGPTDGTHTVGCYRGAFAALNVRNPQPGVRYAYESLSRGGAKILSRLNRGYELVRDTDPEQWGGTLPITAQGQNGTIRAFGDVALVRIRLERYAAEQADKALRAKVALQATEADYRERGQNLANRLGALAPSDNDLYFARPGHMTREE